LLLEAMCQRAGVPERQRLIVPAVFVGQAALIGNDITDQSLEDLFAEQRSHSEDAPWNISEKELDAARDRLIERFGRIGLVPVLVGGLIDSINPCAFATLVFFIGYIATTGRGGRDVFAVGGAFTVGVFAAYLATGLGLSELLLGLEGFPLVSRVVTGAIIALTFVLSAVCLYDFVQAVRGNHAKIALKLPHSLRMRINRLIARKLRASGLIVSAISLGCFVSLLELACTGQVYLPLIRFMNSVSVDRVRTFGLLLAYNTAFVLPLMVIFTAASLGLSSERLMALLQRQIAPVKLGMAVFFASLGLLLIHFS